MHTPSSSGTFPIQAVAPAPCGATIFHGPTEFTAGMNAGCAGVIPSGSIWFGTTMAPATFPGGPCPGCGTNYLTCAVNPMYPHSFGECAAYKRGYEAGLAAAARGNNP